MLGLEHVASRGSIGIEYYGRNVGIKIMPIGVKPERYLNGFGWQDTIWRRGELLSQVSRLISIRSAALHCVFCHICHLLPFLIISAGAPSQQVPLHIYL